MNLGFCNSILARLVNVTNTYIYPGKYQSHQTILTQEKLLQGFMSCFKCIYFFISFLFFHEILYSFSFLRKSNCQILLTHPKIEDQQRMYQQYMKSVFIARRGRRIFHTVFIKIQPLNQNFLLPTWHLYFLF